jgi:uncharacterized membrane protein YkvA (DUF1232 family)
MRWLRRWKGRVADLRREVVALYLAVRDPRCLWYARALAAVVIAYALSPLDLIPDFIPVLGLLDDLVLVPLGLLAVRRLIPAAVLDDARRRAETEGTPPASRLAAAVIVALWLVLAGTVGYWVWRGDRRARPGVDRGGFGVV